MPPQARTGTQTEQSRELNTTETDKHGELFTSTRAVLASADPELSAARSPKTRNDKLFSCVLQPDLRSDEDDLLEYPSSFKNEFGWPMGRSQDQSIEPSQPLTFRFTQYL